MAASDGTRKLADREDAKSLAGTRGRDRYSRQCMLNFRRKEVLNAVAMAMVCGLGFAGNIGAAPEAAHSKKSKKPVTEPTAAPVAGTPASTVPAADSTPDAATPAPNAATEVLPLTSEQMAAALSLDTITVPTPGELFAALNKQCKPNWTGEFRGPITTAYSDRAQAALNLGGLIADGYIAVEAMDKQQVKNLGRDILALSKNLGISKGILDRGESIKRFSDDSDWNALKEELEAMQNEVKQEMEALQDDELITLLSLGAWIRGTYVVSDVVLKNFSQNTSCILRQPALIGYLRSRLDKLSPRLKDSPFMKSVGGGVESLGKLVSFPLGETASKDDVQKLHDQAGDLLNVIAKKEN